MAHSLSSHTQTQYEALTGGVGVADVSDRTCLQMAGVDRSKVMHNLCTNAIQPLAPGQGCEAFVLNVKGKVLGHINVFFGADAMIIDAAPGQTESLKTHFDKYTVTEDIRIDDLSGVRRQWLVAGPNAAHALSQATGKLPPGAPHSHFDGVFSGIAATVCRVATLGPESFYIACSPDSAERIAELLKEQDAVMCDAAAVDIARVEAGYPVYGVDITLDALPQEVNRNAEAINFQKGCYLGQETVARIDALGHVNRKLVSVKFQGDQIPPAGAELRSAEGGSLGKVTSAVYSPALGAPLALAYVRSSHTKIGSPLESDFGAAEVVAPPLAN